MNLFSHISTITSIAVETIFRLKYDYKNRMKLKDDSSEYTLGNHPDVLNCLAEGLKNSYLVYFFVTFSQNFRTEDSQNRLFTRYVSCCGVSFA